MINFIKGYFCQTFSLPIMDPVLHFPPHFRIPLHFWKVEKSEIKNLLFN